MKKYLLYAAGILALMVLVFSCAEKKQNTVSSTGAYPLNQLSDSVAGQFNNLVNSSYAATDSGMVALAVFLQQGDQLLVDTAYFFSNNKQPLPNDSTVFQMGSVTKTFTAALIARLVNQGKINLSAPAQNYLPKTKGMAVPTLPNTYNGQPATITPGQLAAMNAGLDRNAPVDPKTNPRATPYRFVFNYLDNNPPLLYQPGGNCYIYSNLGFGILGLIACLQAYPQDIAYYNNYEKLVVDSLLQPLAMNDTRITLDAAQLSRRALPYGKDGEKSTYNNLNWPFNLAAGGLYSTLSDMKLYARAMTGTGHYLTPADIDTLLKPRAYVYPDTCKTANGQYAAQQAMAWIVNADLKDNTGAAFSRYSKDGGLGGFSTFITCSTPTLGGQSYKAWVVLWANKQGFPVQENAKQVLQLLFSLLK